MAGHRQLSGSKKVLACTAVGTMALLALPGSVIGAAHAAEDKIAICHATTSNGTPYVRNEPSKSGDLGGHAGHGGPLWNAGLKAQHVSWGDIIPSFEYDDDGSTVTFPGHNWDAAGQAIWAADCNVPPPVLSLTVDKTNDADTDAAFSADETAVNAGQDVAFTVVVTNTSSVPVVLDSLTDTVAGAVLAFPCAPSVAGVTLAPAASATCTATLSGYSPAAGVAKTNTVTVTGHEGADGPGFQPDLQNTVTKTAVSTVRTRPTPELSLSVVKTNDADQDGTYSDAESAPASGQDVSFRAVVTNTSAVAVALDGITDAVADGEPFPVSCAATLPASLDAGASVTCDFVLPGASPAAGGSVQDLVVVRGHDPLDADNTVTGQDTSTVRTDEEQRSPDLSIVKTGPAQADPGDTITWLLTVTNNGNAPASAATVSDTLPAGVTLDAVSAPDWSCEGTVAISCELEVPLAPGDSSTLTITSTLDAEYALTTVSNTAVVGPVDDTPEDNTSTFVTTVAPFTGGGGGFTGGGSVTGTAGGPSSLPFTGAPLGLLVQLGLGLVLAGTGALLMATRRTA